MAYKILVEPSSVQDIQQAVDYYDEQQVGLGEKFVAELDEYLNSLKKNPFFQIRYDEVHCVPLRRFPFMVHFTIDESARIVTIRAVLHTSLSPEKWKNR